MGMWVPVGSSLYGRAQLCKHERGDRCAHHEGRVLGSVHASAGIPHAEIRSERVAGGLRSFLALGPLRCLL